MASDAPKIIDSHIHLYAETHLTRLNWTADLPADHILNRQSSVKQYRVATGNDPNVLGFVFVETDRKFGHDEEGWTDPLEEITFLARIAQGCPVTGEGHVPADSKLVLGIVPWAPIPAGPVSLAKYVSKVREACGDDRTFGLVKGFRYLLQDKPAGTMLRPDFIAGLKWLGEQNLTFDLGIDARQGGVAQLTEASLMLRRVYESGSKLKVIINHFCKPNLRFTAASDMQVEEAEEFVDWVKCIRSLANHSTTYMKLSGLFSELPPQDESSPVPISQLAEQVKPWVTVVLRAFGPSRVMFGSDWPVCSAGGPGSKSWQHWIDLVAAVLDGQGLNAEEKQRIWSGTAAEAYNVTIAEQ